jgi:hypothetical protein
MGAPQFLQYFAVSLADSGILSRNYIPNEITVFDNAEESTCLTD